MFKRFCCSCFIIAIFNTSAFAATTGCLFTTTEACLAACGSFKYCCPDPDYIEATCPSGWSYNSRTNLCTRIQETSEDDIGYKTVRYGSCSPTNVHPLCFEPSNTNSYGDDALLRCVDCN